MKTNQLLLLSLFFFFLYCTPEENTPTIPEPSPPTGNGSIGIIQDEVNGQQIVLAGSPFHGFIVSFERELEDGSLLDFSPKQDELPIIMTDQEGNEWDLFGNAVSGPREGQQLKPAKSTMGYWFSFASMYPGVPIYQGPAAKGVPDPLPPDENWSIPTDFVFRGSGFDAIRSLEAPAFETYDFKADVERSFYVKENDLVIGLKIGSELRFYPHAILDWHEIVNDRIQNTSLSLIYCPLTGTTSVWDRMLNGQETSFGVSGLLYNSNVMPFDRATNSIWTQLDAECVNGDLIGQAAKKFSFAEMKWESWLKIYRLPKVLSLNQGGGFDYTEYPYADYRTNHEYLAYPITFDDDRLPRKERVHAVIVEREAKVYRMENFR